MSKYIKRSIEKKLTKLSESFPVIMITGSRQVGKTTLLNNMREQNKINYVSLDDLATRSLAIEDPEMFLARYKAPLIIDEFQYAPDLLTYIKIIVDKQRQEHLKNEELQAQVDALTVENTQLLQDRDELNSLRDLYELDHKYESYEKVGARVIAKEDGSNWYNQFTINKGTMDGLAVDMNVIAGAGLVGIIVDVGPNWATVRSIIDDYSNVSAEISETSETCIIAGDLKLIDDGKLQLVKLEDPESKAKTGDTIVTSQISDKFLPGILIGYISEIGTDANNLTRSGYVSPVVNFDDIKEVLVIKNLKETAKK